MGRSLDVPGWGGGRRGEDVGVTSEASGGTLEPSECAADGQPGLRPSYLPVGSLRGHGRLVTPREFGYSPAEKLLHSRCSKDGERSINGRLAPGQGGPSMRFRSLILLLLTGFATLPLTHGQVAPPPAASALPTVPLVPVARTTIDPAKLDPTARAVFHERTRRGMAVADEQRQRPLPQRPGSLPRGQSRRR